MGSEIKILKAKGSKKKEYAQKTNKSVRTVALSLDGILCSTNISVCNVSRSHSLELEMIELNFPLLF